MPKISVKPRMGRPRQVVELTPEPDLTEAQPAISPPDLTATESLDEETGESSEPLASRVVIPPPPQFRFDTDSPRGRRPEDFFNYWNGLSDGYKKWVMCYVYRNWPVIQIMVPDKKHGGVKPTCQIEKLAGEDVIHNMDELVQRYGSGDYTLRLNRQKPSQPIALCTIRGIRDMEYHPPCHPPNLMDVLVMDDPANRDFINQLRLKGAWKDKEMEEQQMAAGEMASALTGTIEHLSNKLAEKSKEPSTNSTTSATDAAKETVAMAREVFKEGIELGKASVEAQADAKVKAADEKLKAADEKAKATEADANPSRSISMLRELTGLLKDLQPSQTAAPPAQGGQETLVDKFMTRVADLQGQVLKMNEDRVTALEKLIAEMRAQPTGALTVAKQEDFFANLDKLVQAKDKFQALFGGGEPDEKEEKVPAWMNLAQSAMSGLPAVATALLAMSYNMAIAKTGSGTPIPPGPIENPALPPAPDNPKPAAGTGEKPVAVNVYATFLSQIERPLINHLNDPSKTGADFADWVSSGFGDIGYQAAKELGKDTLLALLASRPSIASVIQQIPERTAQFIDEFLTADEPDEGDDEPLENVRTFVAPPQGSPQVVDVPPIVQVQEGARPRRKATPAAV